MTLKWLGLSCWKKRVIDDVGLAEMQQKTQSKLNISWLATAVLNHTLRKNKRTLLKRSSLLRNHLSWWWHGAPVTRARLCNLKYVIYIFIFKVEKQQWLYSREWLLELVDHKYNRTIIPPITKEIFWLDQLIELCSYNLIHNFSRYMGALVSKETVKQLASVGRRNECFVYATELIT